MSPVQEPALVLAGDQLTTRHAKTTHALLRGSRRFSVSGVVAWGLGGRDAGEIMDGTPRQVPIFDSVPEALDRLQPEPRWCLVGVATAGGHLPAGVRRDLVDAAGRGLSLVNGMHQLMEDDADLVRMTRERGARLIDLRRPRPARECRFWTGEVLALATPRVAVLGTDCAVGKRTTCTLLQQACARRGVRAGMVHTGQTGWMIGVPHGFVLDATPNDFVCGELERAILDCNRDLSPDLILLEGQSSLRNPSGPCGAELLISAGASTVVLQHDPARREFEGTGRPMPPIEEEIEIIRLLGSRVVAITLNDAALDDDQALRIMRQLTDDLGLPVARPLSGGVESVLDAVLAQTGARKRP